MKKLSLILALILVLAYALVACGGEEEASSTPETESSVAATEESSEAAVEESSEAATEESSEAEESTGIAAGTENLAADKSYTHSVLFRQGSAGYDPEAPISYPDESGKSFTDGIIPEDNAGFTAEEWVGFNAQDPNYEGFHWIIVDLGEKKDLAKYVFKYGTSALSAGITSPATIEIYVSDDGETWGDAIAGDVPDDDPFTVNGVYEASAAASGRYVKFSFTSGGWAFISEVEVYGAAE